MIRTNATGCSLIDKLCRQVDSSSGTCRKQPSREPGDGGFSSWGLVFAEALTEYPGSDFRTPSAKESLI